MAYKSDNKNEDRKKCPRCGKNKLITNYYISKTINQPASYCIACTKAKAREWNKVNRVIKGSNAWYRRRYDHLKHHYKYQRFQKGFDLSFHEYMKFMKDTCFYCEEKFELLSVDRVNNDKGYSVDNCVAACSSCNRSKNSVSVDICRKVIQFVDNR